MQPSESIYAKIDQIETLLDEIDKLIPLVAEDWEDATLEGDTLFHFKAMKDHVNETYKDYDATVWPSFQNGLTLANGAELESVESTPRSGWKHKELSKRVAQRIVDESFDWETGEAYRTHEEMVLELMKYVGVSYWKLKALRGINIDPDQYSIPKDPVRSVKIIKPKE